MTSKSSIAALLLAILPAPVLAQEKPPTEKPDKPITDREPSAVDVAATPVTDLGLRKGEIPQLLLTAQASPYDLEGLRTCPTITAAIVELDAVLGDDLDLPQDSDGGISPGRVAQAAVGSFIPFRGLIREISGANAHERKLVAAIYAGGVRRAFLKGVGQQRGCVYPARSATPAIAARLLAEREAAKAAEAAAKRDEDRAEDD